MILSVLMIIGAGGLQLYNNIQNDKSENETMQVISEIEKIFRKQLKQQDENKKAELQKFVNINGNNYIGVIYVPNLDNLTLPVIDKCTTSNLKVSVCRYNGTAENNNLIIAGHNYKYSFGKLSKLNVGSIVYFKNMEGITYKYKCKEILKLSPKSVYEMQTGNWDLTLFTCTFDNLKRLTLRFELVNEV